MKRIVLAGLLLPLLGLPAPATAEAPSSVIDLVAHPEAMKDLELPKLLDLIDVYPDESQKLNERGTVRMTFVVGTDGLVSDVKIVHPSHYWRLNDAAVTAMLGRSYEPAIRNGTPVAVRIWAIDNFNPDPAVADPDVPLDADHDLAYSCRYGTHHIAVDACSTVLATGKGRPKDVLYPRAHAYMQLGQYAQAIADYDTLIGLVPERADLYRNRGFAYEAEGQYEKAIADYDHAVNLDPVNDIVYFDRGFAWDRLGRHDRALESFNAGLDHRPQCEKVSLRGVGADWTPVPEIETKPNLLVPPDSPFHPTLGSTPGGGLAGSTRASSSGQHMTNATGGTTQVAVTTRSACKPSWVRPLEEIADIAPGSPDEVAHLEYRCWARVVWVKVLDGALADCDRALTLNPGFVQAYATRGWAYARKGDQVKAIENFDEALEKNAGLASALYLRGLSRLKTGDKTGADADILAARKVDPDVAATYARYDMTP